MTRPGTTTQIALFVLFCSTGSVARATQGNDDAELEAPTGVVDSSEGGSASSSDLARLRPDLGSPYEVKAGGSTARSFTKDNSRKLGFSSLGVKAALPLFNAPAVRGGIRAEYALHHVEVKGFDTWVDRDSVKLHRFGLTPSAGFKLSAGFLLVLRAGVVVASDFEDTTSHAVQPEAQVLNQWVLSSSLALLFGAGVSRQFLETAPYPLLGLVWAPRRSAFRLDLLAPTAMRARWAASERLELALTADYAGLVWQIGERDEVPGHLIKSATVRTGGAVRYALTESVFIDASAGVHAFHKVSLRTETEIFSGTLDPGAPYAGLTLAMNPF